MEKTINDIKREVRFKYYRHDDKFKPEKEYPTEQRDYRLTEKRLKQEETFVCKLIYDMGHVYALELCKTSDRVQVSRYLDCVRACIDGKLVDLKKAYWDLGINEYTKKFSRNTK